MMRKIVIIAALLLLAAGAKVKAQTIRILEFERNVTSLIASVNPAYDNAGDAGAVIQFFVRDMDYIIEPNLGVLRSDTLPGEIRLWVPKGTKRITVRHIGMMPLAGYEIPIPIESKITYRATIDVSETIASKKKKDGCVFLIAGYNTMSISGPSLGVGFEVKNHIVELGAIYGLNGSDDLFFYDNNGNVNEAYSYKPLRIQLRYGYSIDIGIVSVIPQVGCAYNFFSGGKVADIRNASSKYETSSSLSAFGALRLQAALNDHFKIHVTPEYDLGVYKDQNCKWIADYDKTFKSWTDGFSLNIGLTVSL